MNRVKSFISISIFTIIIFSVFQLAFMYYETRNKNALRQTLINEVSYQAQELYIRLTDSLTALNTMESILVMEEYKSDKFDFWGRVILENNPRVSAVQLAPDGVVQYIVPLEGNEKVVGHDLLSDSRRSSGARKTIDSKEITFVGPLRLIQNGRMAVIARKPVFREVEGEETFWGFVIVLIDLDELVKSDHGMNFDFPVAWRLLGQDPDNNQGTGRPLIEKSSNADSVKSWNVSYDIPVPNGHWRMQMAYVDASGRDFVVGQSLVFLLTALFAGIFLIQQIRVSRRNDKILNGERQARRERKQFMSILDSIPEMIYVADMETHEVVFANQRLKEILGEDIAGKKCFKALHGRDQKCPNCINERLTDLSSPTFTEEYRPLLQKHFYVMNRTIQWTESRKARFELAIDITKRIQFEEQLRQSEAKYRLLAENVADVIWVLNLGKMKFSYISPSVYTLRGYTPEEAMQHDINQSLAPESAENVISSISEKLPRLLENPDAFSKRIFYDELRQPCKDGRLIWIETTTRYRVNEDGEAEVIGISRNIDERKKQQNLLETRLRYEENIAEFSSSLMPAQPDELDNCLQYLVHAAQCSRVYIFENFIDPENRVSFRQTHEARAKGIPSELDNSVPRRLVYEDDGFARWEYELSRNRIISGIVAAFPESERVVLEPQGIKSILVIPIRVSRKWYGFIGFDENLHEKEWSNEDISLLRTASEILGMYFERAQAEESLKASEEHFRLAFENANDGACIVSLDGKLLRVNQSMIDIFGYSRTELESFTVMDISHPEDKDISPKFIERNIAGEAVSSVFEKRYIHKNGRIIWGQVSSSLVRNDRGEPLHFISHVQDISDRKEMERLKEDVDRIMRHDLRTPLNAIIGFPQILRKADNLSQEQISIIETMENAGLEMLQMIDFSLDLFKMESGSYTFCPEIVDVVDVLTELMEQKQNEIRSRSLSLNVTLDDAPFIQGATFFVESERHLLYSMLANLLTNAIEASPMNNVIEIRLKQGEPTVIAIRNKGAVPKDIRKTFFQKYSTYGKEKGTGIGTYSAKIIAGAMGYELRMQAWDNEDITEVSVMIPGSSQENP